MTLNLSQLGTYQTLVEEEIAKLKLTADGATLLSLIENSEQEFQIIVTEDPFDINTSFSAYNPLINTVRINIDELLNSRIETVLDGDNSDSFTYALGQNLFHELLHAWDIEFSSDGVTGPNDHDGDVSTPDIVVLTTNAFTAQYGHPARDANDLRVDRINENDSAYKEIALESITSEYLLSDTPVNTGLSDIFIINFFIPTILNPDLGDSEKATLIRTYNEVLTDTQKNDVLNAAIERNGVQDLPEYLIGGVGVEGAFGTFFEPLRGWYDPLAIDLDGSGDIEELPADSVYFDIDDDGQAEAVSWISGNDGWLARDLDGDGEIDGVAELFGVSGDGFADLALLDSNADGKIDTQDAAYDELLVWQDRNEDGITQDGELLSVANDLFIRELPTSPIDGTLENVTEAAIGQLHIEDIFLNTDNRNAISAEDIPLDLSVIGLPDLRGYGRVNTLWQEMSLNNDLRQDVASLSTWSLENIFTDFADFRDDFNTVLYKWTGVNDIAIDSRGPNLDDARKLELLEEFDDREFLQFGNVQNSSNPQTLTGQGILRAYDVFEQAVFARFVNQIGGDQLFENDVVYNRFTDEFVIDGAVVLNATLLNDLGTAGTDPAVTDTLAYWKNIIFVLDNTIDLSSLDAAQEAKLDAAIALTDPTLDFAGVEASYEADFPPAPIAGTTTDELFNGTALADDISGELGTPVNDNYLCANDNFRTMRGNVFEEVHYATPDFRGKMA